MQGHTHTMLSQSWAPLFYTCLHNLLILAFACQIQSCFWIISSWCKPKCCLFFSVQRNYFSYTCMHCHNTTEGSPPLHEGILRACSRDLGKDSPKNLMTEEFIMLSYLLRLYNTEPNNVFTEAGSKFRHWLFLSLFFFGPCFAGTHVPSPNQNRDRWHGWSFRIEGASESACLDAFVGLCSIHWPLGLI